EHAFVERKLLPGLEPDDTVLAHLQLDAALLSAKTTVRLDQTVGRALGILLPAAGRLELRMWPETRRQRGQVRWGASHAGAPSTAIGHARASFACTMDTGLATSRPSRPRGSRIPAAARSASHPPDACAT